MVSPVETGRIQPENMVSPVETGRIRPENMVSGFSARMAASFVSVIISVLGTQSAMPTPVGAAAVIPVSSKILPPILPVLPVLRDYIDIIIHNIYSGRGVNVEFFDFDFDFNILTAFIRLGRAGPVGAGCPPYL